MRTKIASMKYLLYFIAAVMMFGSSGIVASTLPLSAFEVCLMRLIIGALFMGLIFVVTRQQLPRHIGRRQYLFVALSGACLGLAMMTIFAAYRLLGVGLGAVLAATAPVITMALSPLLFKEHLRLPVVVGFAIVVGGLLLLNASALEGTLSVPGILMGLAAAAGTAGMVIFNKLARDITGIPCTTIQLATAVAVALAVAAAGEGFAFIGRIPLSSWPTVIALGAVFTALAYFLYYRAIDQLPMQTVSVCAYAEPLTAVVLGALVLGEVMTPVQLAGACCIIGGALLGEARVKMPAAQRRRMRRAYVRLVRAPSAASCTTRPRTCPAIPPALSDKSRCALPCGRRDRPDAPARAGYRRRSRSADRPAFGCCHSWRPCATARAGYGSRTRFRRAPA